MVLQGEVEKVLVGWKAQLNVSCRQARLAQIPTSEPIVLGFLTEASDA